MKRPNLSKKNVLKVSNVIRHKNETLKNAKKRAINVIKSSPAYEPKKWNEYYTRKSHNCYTYFLNKRSKRNVRVCKNIRKKDSRKKCPFPQPGFAAGYNKFHKKRTSCKKYTTRLLADNKNIKRSKDGTCPNGYRAGALATQPSQEYHFYRQDNDGYWSHKDAARKTRKTDASGKRITNPRTADRNHDKKRNYTHYCGIFCIPSDNKKIRMKRLAKRRKTNKNKK
tara:strand:+ start:2174 stop:2848 length:675 start_codon:yes stop_codon:yes gene_type:complete